MTSKKSGKASLRKARAKGSTTRTRQERPKVSVIMPVYNMAEHLEAGLASVREQNLGPLEIICVDDGSTDSSAEILARIAAEDSRVRVISQDNQGAGAARNAALSVAQGEFVAFMDPDDCYPDSLTLQTLYWGAVFNDALICGGSFSEKFAGKITTEFGGAFAKYTFPKEAFIDFRDYQFDYGYTRFLYNLDFLKENKIEFPLYLRYQDPPFMAQALATAGKFLAIPDLTYQYSQHDYTKMLWSREQLNDNLRGMIHQLRFSAEHDFVDLHRLTYERFNKDFYDRIVAHYDAANPTEESASTRALLEEALEVLDVDLLNKAYGAHLPEYYLRPLHPSSFSHEGDPPSAIVSVIVPAYNAENYLEECLESLVQQTMSAFEVIVVDDGSWDSTSLIAERFAEQNNRVKVITLKEHTNAAVARNVGIDAARGEYVLFFEADGVATPMMLDSVANHARETKADIVVFGFDEQLDAQGSKFRNLPLALRSRAMPEEQPFSAHDVAATIFNCGSSTSFNKLMRRDFVIEHDLHFQDISSCNDMSFTLGALSRAERIGIYDDVLAHHRVDGVKPLAEPIEYHTSNYFKALTALKGDLESRGVFGEFEQSYVNWAMDFAVDAHLVFHGVFANLMERQLIKRDVVELNLIGYPDDFYCYPSSVQKLSDSTKELNDESKSGSGKSASINPEVSILFVCADSDMRDVALTLDSVQYQTLENIEIFVCADVSNEVADELEHQAQKDSRLVIINSDSSRSDPIRTALEQARGRYLVFVEAGDFLDVSALSAYMEEAEKQEVDILWTDKLLLRHDFTGAAIFENHVTDSRGYIYSGNIHRNALCGSLINTDSVRDELLKLSFEKPLHLVEYRIATAISSASGLSATSSHALYYRALRLQDTVLTTEDIDTIVETYGSVSATGDESSQLMLGVGCVRSLLRLGEGAGFRVRQAISSHLSQLNYEDLLPYLTPAEQSALTKIILAVGEDDVFSARRDSVCFVVPVNSSVIDLTTTVDSLLQQDTPVPQIILAIPKSVSSSVVDAYFAREANVTLLEVDDDNCVLTASAELTDCHYVSVIFPGNRCDPEYHDTIIDAVRSGKHDFLYEPISALPRLKAETLVKLPTQTILHTSTQRSFDDDSLFDFSHEVEGKVIATALIHSACDELLSTFTDEAIVTACFLRAMQVGTIPEEAQDFINVEEERMYDDSSLTYTHDTLVQEKDLLQKITSSADVIPDFRGYVIAQFLKMWRQADDEMRRLFETQFLETWVPSFSLDSVSPSECQTRSDYRDFLGIIRNGKDSDYPCEISVIIPCYNVENYISETLTSVLEQTFQDFEIICIDDGSSDNTVEVLEAFSEEHPQVRVISSNPPVNRGPGGARNFALKDARGKYIYFMDSDDLLRPNCFETIYRQAETHNLDLLYFEADSFYETTELRQSHSYEGAYHRFKEYPGIHDGLDLFIDFQKNPRRIDFRVSVCLQLIRRSVIEENNIRFPDLAMHVDEVYSVWTLISCYRVMVLRDSLYLRRVREGSVITQTSSHLRRIRAAIGVNKEFLRLMASYESDDPAFEIIRSRFDRLVAKINRLNDEADEQQKQEMVTSLTAEELAIVQMAKVLKAERADRGSKK